MKRAGSVVLCLLLTTACDPEAQVDKAIKRSGLPTRKAPERTAEPSPVQAAPVVIPAARPAPVCPLLTNEEASAAFGSPVKATAAVGRERCSFGPEPGAPDAFSVTIDGETGGFYSLTAEPGAQIVDVGDRAVWLKQSLHVIIGKRRIIVEIGRGAGDSGEMLRRAQAIGRAVVENL